MPGACSSQSIIRWHMLQCDSGHNEKGAGGMHRKKPHSDIVEGQHGLAADMDGPHNVRKVQGRRRRICRAAIHHLTVR